MSGRGSELHSETDTFDRVDERAAEAEDGHPTRDLRAVDQQPREGIEAGDAGVETTARLERLERQNRWLKYGLALVAALMGYLVFGQVVPEQITVRQRLMESEEVKLVDTSGNTRLFLRMYSRVPVLQLLDSKGKPRLSMGMRFDDTPFIDLSDKSGRTRATFEMTEDDHPTLRLFDENGDISFKIK